MNQRVLIGGVQTFDSLSRTFTGQSDGQFANKVLYFNLKPASKIEKVFYVFKIHIEHPRH